MAAKSGRKKQRWVQPGNTDALRHGFDSRKFHDLEVEDLGQVKGGHQDEIAMLWVSICRIFERATKLGDEFADKGPGSELFALSQLLTTLGIATMRLVHMLRTQEFLDEGSVDPLEDLIRKVLDVLKGEERGVYSARAGLPTLTSPQPTRLFLLTPHSQLPTPYFLLPAPHNRHRFKASNIS